MKTKRTVLASLFISASLFTTNALSNPSTHNLQNPKDLVTLTKNTGLAMVVKGNERLLTTLNGRYVVSGNFVLQDTVTGATIETLDDARFNLDQFSPEKSAMLNDDSFLSLGEGDKNVYVILNPLAHKNEIKALNSHISSNDAISSHYQARFVFLGTNDEQNGYGVMLSCDLDNALTKRTATDRSELCQSGFQRMSRMFMMGMMYDFDKRQSEFPIVIKDGKMFKNANVVNYFK